MTKQQSAALAGDVPDRRKGWLAAGGVLGAVLASTCCIGPLVLLSLGISGAWIGNLTALEPYKPVFAAIALVFIGLGFWQVYVRPRMACEPGSYCARPGALHQDGAVVCHRSGAGRNHDRLVGPLSLLNQEDSI